MAASWQCHGVGRRSFAGFGPFDALDEALDGFTATHFKVINTERFLIHAKLHSTNVIELIDMDFAFQT